MTIPSGRAVGEIPIERVGYVPFGLSWGAIFAGLLVALVLQLVLTLAGAAVGLAAWDPNSGSALGIGAAIWAIVSILISLYVGGATAGWAAGALTRPAGMLHGILVWALSTLIMTWLVASGVSSIAGTTFRVFGNVAGSAVSVAAKGVGAGMGAMVSNIPTNGNVNAASVRTQVESILRETGDPALNPDTLAAKANRVANTAAGSASNGDVVSELGNMIAGTASSIDRNDVINVVVARTGASRPQAERVADRLISLKQTAMANLDSLGNNLGSTIANKAEAAASVTAGALWWTLLGLGLSLAAAIFGAISTATSQPDAAPLRN